MSTDTTVPVWDITLSFVLFVWAKPNLQVHKQQSNKTLNLWGKSHEILFIRLLLASHECVYGTYCPFMFQTLRSLVFAGH